MRSASVNARQGSALPPTHPPTPPLRTCRRTCPCRREQGPALWWGRAAQRPPRGRSSPRPAPRTRRCSPATSCRHDTPAVAHMYSSCTLPHCCTHCNAVHIPAVVNISRGYTHLSPSPPGLHLPLHRPLPGHQLHEGSPLGQVHPNQTDVLLYAGQAQGERPPGPHSCQAEPGVAVWRGGNGGGRERWDGRREEW